MQRRFFVTSQNHQQFQTLRYILNVLGAEAALLITISLSLKNASQFSVDYNAESVTISNANNSHSSFPSQCHAIHYSSWFHLLQEGSIKSILVREHTIPQINAFLSMNSVTFWGVESTSARPSDVPLEMSVTFLKDG